MKKPRRSESYSFKAHSFNAGITLNASINLEPAKDWLTQLFADIFDQPNDSEDVQDSVAYALSKLKHSLPIALGDALQLLLTEEVPVGVLYDLNGQTPLGKARLYRKKGTNKTEHDGSLAASIDEVARRYYDQAKERMWPLGKGRPPGSHILDDREMFNAKLMDAIRNLPSSRVSKKAIWDEMVRTQKMDFTSYRQFDRKLKLFDIDLKAIIKQAKMDI